VAEANTTIGADSNAWRAILDPGRVVVTPLDESTAIDLGRTVGRLVIRHVVREASQTQGEIVTAAPWQYPADTADLDALDLRSPGIRVPHVPVMAGCHGEQRGTEPKATWGVRRRS
jgi:hypothetical protein